MTKRIELANPIFEHGLQFQRALRHQLSKFDVEKECTFPDVLKAWISVLKVYDSWPRDKTWWSWRTFNQSVGGLHYNTIRLDMIFQVWATSALTYVPYYAGLSLRQETTTLPWISTHVVPGNSDPMEYGAALADRYRERYAASSAWRRILHASFYDTSPLEVEMPAPWPASKSDVSTESLGDQA